MLSRRTAGMLAQPVERQTKKAKKRIVERDAFVGSPWKTSEPRSVSTTLFLGRRLDFQDERLGELEVLVVVAESTFQLALEVPRRG